MKYFMIKKKCVMGQYSGVGHYLSGELKIRIQFIKIKLRIDLIENYNISYLIRKEIFFSTLKQKTPIKNRRSTRTSTNAIESEIWGCFVRPKHFIALQTNSSLLKKKSVAFYGSEMRTIINKKDKYKLEVQELRCRRKLQRICWTERWSKTSWKQ